MAESMSSPAIQVFRNSGFQFLQPLHPPKNALRKSRRAMQANEVHAGCPKTPAGKLVGGRMGVARGAAQRLAVGTPFCNLGALAGGAAAKFSEFQADSTSLATSPMHSAHLPTSNKSPDLTAPEKLLMLTAWAQVRHHTLASSSLRVSGGMAFQSLAAGAVKLGSVSMVMRKSSKRMGGFCRLSSALSNVGGN